MMFMSRHGGGRVLRAFAIASAVALAAGGVALAVRAEAAPAAAVQTAFGSGPDGIQIPDLASSREV